MGGPYQDSGFGLEVDLTAYGAPLTAHDVLFSESHGRAVVTCPPERVSAVEALAREHGVPVHRVGTVGDAQGEFRVKVRAGAVDTIEEPVARLREVYFNAIPRRMGD
jgi:phosphoribosylformylglycinamidine synthase